MREYRLPLEKSINIKKKRSRPGAVQPQQSEIRSKWKARCFLFNKWGYIHWGCLEEKFIFNRLRFTQNCICCMRAQSCLALCDPIDCVALQAPLSMGFSRQEYWSGLPSSPPGDLSDPGVESASLAPPEIAGGFLCHLFVFTYISIEHQGLEVGKFSIWWKTTYYYDL